jgi:very-short-patch-repair endonuclease
MDVQVRELASRQVDLFAAWQLLGLGWTREAIRHRLEAAAWRTVHSGVFTLTHSALTQVQQWMAASLTAPDTYLGDRSAANCWGFADFAVPVETVVRNGSGGPRRLDGVLVRRSILLPGETTRKEGIPITTAARTLIDVCAGLSQRAAGRAFRESLRLRVTSARELAACLFRHKGRRGTAILWDLSRRYSTLPYWRCRSNAEARALEILHDAGLSPDRVNAEIRGIEADLVWDERKLIIEIDGPQFHQFKDEDERKQAVWEAAGYTVRRVPSDVVFNAPEVLIARAAA